MFKSEEELVILLKRVLTENGLGLCDEKLSNMLILEEVSLGLGIADLVVTFKKKCTRRTPLTKLEIHILTSIKTDEGISYDKLINSTRISKSKLINSLSSLEKNNLVICQDGKYYIKDNYEFCISDTIAIEAKLTNWRRAINQAYHYKWFSYNSFVCMPKDSSKPAIDNLNMFKKLEIGLMTIDNDGNLECVFYPPKSKPIEPKMSMLLNEQVISICQI